MVLAGEASEPLQVAGFVLVAEVDECADDEDGSLRPPLRGSNGSRGGGVRNTSMLLGDPRAVPIEIWSLDKDSGSKVGFVCQQDLAHRLFYAKLEGISVQADGGQSDAFEARSMKGAITTLLDVAEACYSRKITLGLGHDHAGCTDLLCSLLYLGFQVVPSRKSPMQDTALLLEFDLGVPSHPTGGGMSSSDHTCPGTSECSTEDDGCNSEPESD